MLLSYGKEKMTLNLPKDVKSELLEMSRLPVIKNPEEEIKQALMNPIAEKPLHELVNRGEKICLLVNDSTRVARSEVFLPILIDELKKSGIKEEDIFIVFTAGTHRPLREEEMRDLVGARVASTIAMYNHDCFNDNQLVKLGDTSYGSPVYVNKMVYKADKRILTGSIVYHFFAGFGGGRKALVPGVAGYKTIQKNHSYMLHDNARLGNLEGNPVHEDQLEAAKMIGGDFLLNVVLNENKEFIGIFAGDMEKAHLAGCNFVKKAYGVGIKKLADLTIASCGGYPKDINVYQAHKTLENAIQATKPGGQVILLAQCPEGIGSEKYEKWAKKYPDLKSMEKALAEDFEIGGHKAFTVGRLVKQATVHLVSELPEETASLLGFVPARNLDEALKKALEKEHPELTYILPQGSLSVPILK